MSYRDSSNRKLSTTESVLLLASEDINDLGPNDKIDDAETGSLINRQYTQNYHSTESPIPEDTHEDDDILTNVSIFKIKNLFQIEVSLLLNVLLAAFDGTITASTYTIIGSEFNAVNLGSWITTSYLITST